MIKIEENTSLLPFNTFGIDVRAKLFVEIESIGQLIELIQTELYAKENRLVLGGGSNILFTRDFDGLVLEQKVNYNEAAFFYGFLEDKTKLVQMAREVNEVFLKLMDVFLDDSVLTESEHDKLNQFLESIRYKISTPQYYEYKNQIQKAYEKYGQKV